MAGPIRIAILANASQARREITGVGTSAERSTSRAKSALKGLAAGFIAFEAFDKIREGLKGSIEQAREAQKTNAQTAAAIKSTGGVANVSAAQVKEYADSLGRTTGQNADVIQSGENMLLTFKNIRNEVGKGNQIFTRASTTVTNLATAMAGDGSSSSSPKRAAIQLGKALNDPIKGLSSLSRIGVQFNAQQTAQIKKMVDSGHTLKAQKVILHELNTEFGGSAKAQATAGSRLKETFRQIESEIGTKLLPILDKVEIYVAEHLPQWMAKGEAGVEKVRAAFEKVQPFIETVVNFLKKNPDTVKAFAVVLGVLGGAVALVTVAMAALDAVMAVNPFVLAAIAIATLAAGLVFAYHHSQKFRAVVDATFAAIKAIVPPVVSFVVGFIKDHWSTLLVLLGGPIGLAAVIIIKNFDKIKAAVRAVGAVAKWLWNNAFQPALKFIVTGLSFLMDIWAKMLHALGHVPGFGWAKSAGDAMQTAADKARALADNIRNIPDGKSVKVVLNVVEGVVHTTGGRVPLDPRSVTGPSRSQTPRPISLTVNAPVGSDPYTIGESLRHFLDEYDTATAS